MRRNHIQLAFAVLLYLLSPATPCSAQEQSGGEKEAVQIGWPAMAGPGGNFLPLQSGERIVDDLTKVSVAWESESSDIGIAKQGTPFGKSFQSGKAVVKYLGEEAQRHPSNWAGCIVAEGKVFAASVRPVGPFVECNFPDKTPAKVRVDAEDFVIAMEFNTGKTLWVSAEPGSILPGGGKRQGFQVSPVYSQGKIFAMGATGRLLAYEAATGKKLWQADIGPAAQAKAEERAAILASLSKRKFAYPKDPAWHTSLIVAQNTLVVPTFIKGALRGVDPATGKTLWETTGVSVNTATPSVYRSGGREYILTANATGEMRLLDPQTGKELWKVTGLGPNYFTLAPSSTHVVVNVNARSGKAKGEERVYGFYGCFRLSPEKAELAWKMPEDPANGIEVWMDSCARYQQTIRDGLVYLYTDGIPHKVPGRFLILKADTGEIVSEHHNAIDASQEDKLGGLWYLMGDKILCRWDCMHGPTHGGRHPWVLWQIQGNKIVRLRGTLDKNEFTNGYEVNMQYPIVAGRLLERNEAGKILCYDLRAR